MIEWDISEMKRLYGAMDQALSETAEELDKEIKAAQVIPKKSGALERSQTVKAEGDAITVSYDTPYARRLYYHPEYNFSQDKNANARGLWLDDWADGQRVVEIYGKAVKEKV